MNFYGLLTLQKTDFELASKWFGIAKTNTAIGGVFVLVGEDCRGRIIRFRRSRPKHAIVFRDGEVGSTKILSSTARGRR